MRPCASDRKGATLLAGRFDQESFEDFFNFYMRLRRFRTTFWVGVLFFSALMTVVPTSILCSRMERFAASWNDEESENAETDPDGEEKAEEIAKYLEESWLHRQWALSQHVHGSAFLVWHHMKEDLPIAVPASEIPSPPPEYHA